MSSKADFHPRSNAKEPVHIRRNVETKSDPYIDDEHLPEYSVCRECGDYYAAGRWCSPEKNGKPAEVKNEVVCPACRKLRDKFPCGVVRLSGRFVLEHSEEILNLIRNETRRADSINRLERIMSIQAEGDTIEITTTNEKLAQRIGKAIHKAYSGDIEYKWSQGNKLARVEWRRDS